jgi:prophage maintenance system killer protein
LINNVANKNYDVDEVIDLFGKMITHQLFNDCNKRTSLLFCNALLLNKNLGFIDISKFDDFNKILTKYYIDLKKKIKNSNKKFNLAIMSSFLVTSI